MYQSMQLGIQQITSHTHEQTSLLVSTENIHIGAMSALQTSERVIFWSRQRFASVLEPCGHGWCCCQTPHVGHAGASAAASQASLQLMLVNSSSHSLVHNSATCVEIRAFSEGPSSGISQNTHNYFRYVQDFNKMSCTTRFISHTHTHTHTLGKALGF